MGIMIGMVLFVLLFIWMCVFDFWPLFDYDAKVYKKCECCRNNYYDCLCPSIFDPSYEECLKEFHEKFNQPIEFEPKVPARAELKARLIEEEAKETADALRSGDLVEAVDGMCDLLYVTFGAALEAGVDLYPYFIEVHRTNMNKIGGGVREDGKVLKPAGWQPPKIRDMLIGDGATL